MHRIVDNGGRRGRKEGVPKSKRVLKQNVDSDGHHNSSISLLFSHYENKEKTPDDADDTCQTANRVCSLRLRLDERRASESDNHLLLPHPLRADRRGKSLGGSLRHLHR